MLTIDVLHSIDRSVLCWLGTIDRDGMPNVSPKEVFCAHGSEGLLIANIASPQSDRNIRGNPQVCVSFVDIFVQKGYKLKGRAEIVRPKSPRFSQLEVPLEQITQGLFPIRNIITVQVQTIEPIVAPSYHLMAGTTEASQIAGAMRAYGVKPDA
ncbi:flavin-nucleotide-binding protein [filamentous cyanobacterium CCP5]|nr:flavin-nucleotide-binding protein [filamentous cyanobacterium CCP5]